MDVKRRKCISALLKGGAWATLLSNVPVLSGTKPHALFSLNEGRKRSARYTMVFASPYANSNAEFCPHMHQEFQYNVDEYTNGNVFVDVKDNGALGVGHELMASVSRGKVSSALVSVANLTPAAPELDILNIPFWAADAQRYVNLVTSQIWKNLILDKIASQGNIEILFHYIPGARTISTTRRFAKQIRLPQALEGKVFRVPRSLTLKYFYQMAGASAVDVNWNDVANMAKTGRIEALDPCIVGLYNGPNNLKQQIGAISQVNTVTDGWVAVVSKKWFNAMPLQLQLAIRSAAEQTFVQHLQNVAGVKRKCMTWFTQQGVQVNALSTDERELWVERFGPHNIQWDEIKRTRLGDLRTFELLVEATQQNNGFSIAADDSTA